MNGLRYSQLKDREVLSLTSLSREEFEALVPRFEAECRFYMSEWTLEGKARVKRRHAIYRNCPLPAPEDRLLFVLIYLKNNPVQALHGRLFGLPQGKTNLWLQVLLPVLRQTLGSLGERPARAVEDLRIKALGDPPLFAMTGQSARSSVPRTLLVGVVSTAARKSGMESKTSSSLTSP